MAVKTKNRIKKMNFQLQQRTIQPPLSEEDKYIIKMATYRQRETGHLHENIPRTTRGSIRQEYI